MLSFVFVLVLVGLVWMIACVFSDVVLEVVPVLSWWVSCVVFCCAYVLVQCFMLWFVALLLLLDLSELLCSTRCVLVV